MEIKSVNCACCGLLEDCTPEYVEEVKAVFRGKWLCGLCTEAVKDEATQQVFEVSDEAVEAHMLFCGKFRINPATKVADGMRQLLRNRSRDFYPSSLTSSRTTGKTTFHMNKQVTNTR